MIANGLRFLHHQHVTGVKEIKRAERHSLFNLLLPLMPISRMVSVSLPHAG